MFCFYFNQLVVEQNLVSDSLNTYILGNPSFYVVFYAFFLEISNGDTKFVSRRRHDTGPDDVTHRKHNPSALVP